MTFLNFCRTRRGAATVFGIFLGCLIIVAILSLLVGARSIPANTVMEALFYQGGGTNGAVIRDNRLPRTLIGIVAGAALGAAGALMQAITRNPLAEPGLLGVNSGAAFVVILSSGFLGITCQYLSVCFAFLGAIVAATIVWFIGAGARSKDPARLVLAGICLSALLRGIGQGLALLNPQAFDRFRHWQLGSLDIRSLTPVIAIAPFVAVGLLLALLLGRPLNAIALGDDLAQAVGVNVTVIRILAFAAMTLLAGSATAAVGAIGFLGLMVPHVVRHIIGQDQRRVIAISIVAAPVLLLAADIIGRKIVASELPVGVTMAFLGGPVLVRIARGNKVRAL